MHYWFYGGHMVWMTISWLVGMGFLFGLIWFLVLAIKGSRQARGSPEEILRERYAAGEIDTEEYERRLGELHKTRSVA